MNMPARLVLPGLVLALAFTLTPRETDARMKIGMVVWIGCEDVCRGFKDYVAERKIDADVIVLNADQDKSKLPGFVDKLRAEKVDLAVTWGTKVTMGIAGPLSDSENPRFLNDIPVVFTVVSDPIGSGIIESFERTGRKNVTGTRNRVPESVNIKSIRLYMPKFDHLGILYDESAPNSTGKVDEIRGLTGSLKFKLSALALNSLADGSPDPDSIEPAIAALKDIGVQFIYLGSSSFLERQTDRFTGAAVAAGLPVLTPYEHMVKDSNALMSIAARDYDVGKLAGVQVERILVEGTEPGDIPVLPMEEFAYLVNMQAARKLNLYPPIEFFQFVELVN